MYLINTEKHSKNFAFIILNKITKPIMKIKGLIKNGIIFFNLVPYLFDIISAKIPETAHIANCMGTKKFFFMYRFL